MHTTGSYKGSGESRARQRTVDTQDQTIYSGSIFQILDVGLSQFMPKLKQSVRSSPRETYLLTHGTDSETGRNLESFSRLSNQKAIKHSNSCLNYTSLTLDAVWSVFMPKQASTIKFQILVHCCAPKAIVFRAAAIWSLICTQNHQ